MVARFVDDTHDKGGRELNGTREVESIGATHVILGLHGGLDAGCNAFCPSLHPNSPTATGPFPSFLSFRFFSLLCSSVSPSDRTMPPESWATLAACSVGAMYWFRLDAPWIG